MIPDIPVLHAGPLLLRGHRADDLDASAAMWGDAAVTRFIGGKPQTRQESWARLLRYVGHWALLGYGYWVVEADGQFAGEVGFGLFKRDMEPSIDGIPEIGWVLAPWAHGRGWASLAVGAALAWGDLQLPSARTVCIIAPGNAASIRVAEKCGYAPAGEAVYHARPTLVFARG